MRENTNRTDKDMNLCNLSLVSDLIHADLLEEADYCALHGAECGNGIDLIVWVGYGFLNTLKDFLKIKLF